MVEALSERITGRGYRYRSSEVSRQGIRKISETLTVAYSARAGSPNAGQGRGDPNSRKRWSGRSPDNGGALGACT